MRIEGTLSKYQLVPLVFMQDNLAASQSDVQLVVAEVASAAGLANEGYVMPFAGEIIAVSAQVSAAGSAGSLTVGPTVAGTEKADPTLSITTETAKSDKCRRGTNLFVKDSVIGAEITTSADWNGTTSDLVVIVWVILEVSGI